jgi:hypothetical protein
VLAAEYQTIRRVKSSRWKQILLAAGYKVNLLAGQSCRSLGGKFFPAQSKGVLPMKGANSSIIPLAAFLLGAMAWMMPAPASAGFNAPLAECSQVTLPPLPSCGADPLTRGVVSVSDDGDLDLVLTGAGVSETYSVTYFSTDGSQSTLITNSLQTDGKGKGELRKKVEFALGKAGVGTFVIRRASQNQYVSGIHVAAAQEPDGPDYRARMVRCNEINVPAAVATCGSDTLKDGHVEVDSSDGDLSLNISGAAANATYSLVLRDFAGNDSAPFGTFGTTSKGNGNLSLSGALASGTTSAAVWVLKRNGADQALGGFKVTKKPPPKPASTSGLVRCLDVNDPAALGNCGTDPLTSGSATVDPKGKLMVMLNDAVPSTSYEVFFRPLNSDSSGDVDTNLAITTNVNGDGKGSKSSFAPSGSVGSGNFVVKSGGFDQFVTGFSVK